MITTMGLRIWLVETASSRNQLTPHGRWGPPLGAGSCFPALWGCRGRTENTDSSRFLESLGVWESREGLLPPGVFFFFLSWENSGFPISDMMIQSKSGLARDRKER